MVVQGSPVDNRDWADISTDDTRCYLRVRDDCAEPSAGPTLAIGAVVQKSPGSSVWELVNGIN